MPQLSQGSYRIFDVESALAKINYSILNYKMFTKVYALDLQCLSL